MTVRVVDTSGDAEKMIKTFMDRPHKRHVPMSFSWPKQLQEVGVGKAVMYRSNKWKKNLDDYEDYKHIAEASQTIYVEPGFLREWSNPRKKIPVTGPMVKTNPPMPKHFAALAPLLGVQVHLFEENPDGEIVLPKKSDEFYEVTIARGMIGGAKHPETDEPFLFVYTPNGSVHMLLTGSELDVEKDGIVG